MKRLLSRLWQAFCVLLMVLGLYYNAALATQGSAGVDPAAFMAEILESNGPEGWAIFADDCQLVLENATGRFIGYHPIDENFLAYVAATYGLSGFNDMAAGRLNNSEDWFDYTGRSIHVLWYDYCSLTGQGLSDTDRVEVLPVNGDEFVLEITGDITLAEGVATTLYMDQQMDGIRDCFSKDLIDYMNSADITIVNNEFVFSNRGEALLGKAFTFRARPGRVTLYDILGVDMVSLANNHVYDYGEKGLTDTFQTLKNHDIPYVGAGYNLPEAMRPYYYIYGGRKIAIVAATQIERVEFFTPQATDDRPGVLRTLHDELFVSEIQEAAKNSDVVVCITHWGTEGSVQYGDDQYRLARDFSFAGANVVVGGHTHCLQTVEYIGIVPIYYSLGNFYFASTSAMPAKYDTAIAELRIGQDKAIKTSFIPCIFEDGTIRLAAEDKGEQDRIIKSIADLSDTADIDKLTGLITQR